MIGKILVGKVYGKEINGIIWEMGANSKYRKNEVFMHWNEERKSDNGRQQRNENLQRI